MKHMKKILFIAGLAAMGAISAAPLKVQYASELPEGCRVIAEIKVGDIAMGKPKADVLEGLKKEAEAIGADYLLADIKRVNHPKMGVYYWGWGTAGSCK